MKPLGDEAIKKLLPQDDGYPYYQAFGKAVAQEQLRDAHEQLGNIMISRAMAGFEALPDGEQGFWKGYWQAYMDKGKELLDSTTPTMV